MPAGGTYYFIIFSASLIYVLMTDEGNWIDNYY